MVFFSILYKNKGHVWNSWLLVGKIILRSLENRVTKSDDQIEDNLGRETEIKMKLKRNIKNKIQLTYPPPPKSNRVNQ